MSKGLERGGAYHLLAPSLRDHRTSAVHPATSSGRTGAGWNLLYNGPFMLSLSKHEPHQLHARQNLICTRGLTTSRVRLCHPEGRKGFATLVRPVARLRSHATRVGRIVR